MNEVVKKTGFTEKKSTHIISLVIYTFCNLCRSRIALFTLVAGLTFLFLIANGRPIETGDSVPYRYLPQALVEHGTFRLDAFPHLAAPGNYAVVRDKDGHMISKKPAAPAIVLVPVYLAIRLIRGDFPANEHHRMLLCKLAMSIMAALAAGVFTLLLLRLGLRRRWLAVLAGFGLVAFTPFWFTAQDCWPHPILALLNVCSLILLTRREKKGGWFLIGLLQATAITVRLGAAAVAIIFILAPLALDDDPPAIRWKRFMAVWAGALAPLALLGWYNHFYFGNPWTSGFRGQAANRTQLPFEGLAGFLFAPAKGIFIFSPVTILFFLGFRGGLWRRPEIQVATAALGLHLLFWSCYADWWGGWCYGSRYLVDVMPFLGVLVVLGIDGWLDRTRRKALVGSMAAALALMSFGFQVVGLFTWNADYYRTFDRGYRGQDRLWIWQVPPEPIWLIQRGNWFWPDHIP